MVYMTDIGLPPSLLETRHYNVLDALAMSYVLTRSRKPDISDLSSFLVLLTLKKTGFSPTPFEAGRKVLKLFRLVQPPHQPSNGGSSFTVFSCI